MGRGDLWSRKKFHDPLRRKKMALFWREDLSLLSILLRKIMGSPVPPWNEPKVRREVTLRPVPFLKKLKMKKKMKKIPKKKKTLKKTQKKKKR
jgi:hypothetical protein